MQRFSASPVESVVSLWRNRGLVLTLIKRDVVGRYHGSAMGIAWSFFHPLVLLAIYTVVFSTVFKAHWGHGTEDSKIDFAIILFVGMIVLGLFNECLNRAPNLILENVNYVKKVVFPLEVLPWVALGSALFHAAMSVAVLLLGELLLRHALPWTALLFPIVVIPLLFTTIGIAWFLAALGVYVRDIGQATTMFTTVMLFVSPVFDPLSSLPEGLRRWLWLNPLTYIIEEGRNTLIFGRTPGVEGWIVSLAAGLALAALGFAWFQKMRRGFADVV